MEIISSPEVAEKGVRVGVQVFSDVVQRGWTEDFRNALEEVQQQVRREFEIKEVGEDSRIQAVRRMYSRCGTDPTKFRPCSEALVRRVLKNQSFPQIFPAVDIGNFIALKYRVPLGVYNLDAISPPVEIRLGKEEETLLAIGERVFHTKGRIVAADKLGVFGGPTADSMRTAIHQGTTRILLLYYAPAEIPLLPAMEEMHTWMSRMTHASLRFSCILPSE
ncbi:MAG: B3/B4 domain-containing protein [bacterium JZ-2024 1]